MRPLTGKERAFIRAFLGESRYNAADAARRAVHRWPGKQGHRVMCRPRVRIEIERGFRDRVRQPAT